VQIFAVLLPWTICVIFLLIILNKKTKNTSEEFIDYEDKEESVRVAILDDKAYWVYHNTLYETDVYDGDPDFDSAQPVDTMSLPHKELNRLLYILDSLAE
jgi:hypothetical protein